MSCTCRLVYRPAAGAAAGLLARLLARAGQARSSGANAPRRWRRARSSRRRCAPRWRATSPKPLGIYRDGRRWYSALLEFLALLVNGDAAARAAARGAARTGAGQRRVLFGSEAIEYRSPVTTRVGAMLGIKEYPTPTVVGMYNRLLSAPFPLVLTQSFTFSGAGRRARRCCSGSSTAWPTPGDFAVSQAAQLKDALDALDQQRVRHGRSSLLAAGAGASSTSATVAPDARRLKTLNDHVALARSLLADTGMTVAREDLALEAAFWAQLPGNFAVRPRKAPITSRNFAAMVPFHNYPTGRASGNHWGDALALLVHERALAVLLLPARQRSRRSRRRQPQGHRPHAHLRSDRLGQDGVHRLPGGDAACARASRRSSSTRTAGSRSWCGRWAVSTLALRQRRADRIQPAAAAATPRSTSNFSRPGCACWCAGRARRLTAREQADLDQALRGTLALELPARRLSRLIEFLDPTDPEGVHARLARWCESTPGRLRLGVRQCRRTAVVGRLGGHSLIGFDVTEFLDHELTRAPADAVPLPPGAPARWMAGGWCAGWTSSGGCLSDPAFESFAKDGPKTWRKLNAVMCLATQSASDVLDSPISRTIIEQTPTKIFFPNADASAAEYTDGFGLTEREFKLISEQLEPGSRSFLVKQGHHSVVCQLDLKGFDAELAVISGRARQRRARAAADRAARRRAAPVAARFLDEHRGGRRDQLIPNHRRGEHPMKTIRSRELVHCCRCCCARSAPRRTRSSP